MITTEQRTVRIFYKIEKIKETTGLKNTDIAERMGVSWNTFNNLMSRMSKGFPPTVRMLDKIANALGVDIKIFFS